MTPTQPHPATPAIEAQMAVALRQTAEECNNLTIIQRGLMRNAADVLMRHVKDATPASAEAAWIDSVLLDVAELPDRSSPEDQPDIMLVTAEELRSIIEAHMPAHPPSAERGGDAVAAFEAWLDSPADGIRGDVATRRMSMTKQEQDAARPVWMARAALAAQSAAQQGVPVLYASPGQLRMAVSGELQGFRVLGETSGGYLPVRPTPGGLFTQPLYTTPQPAQQVDDAQVIESICQRIGFGRVQQIAGDAWERIHKCAPRGQMGVTVKDDKAQQVDGKGGALSDAARDVLAERARQIAAEGWTPEHDDEHSSGELALAAACYAAHSASWAAINSPVRSRGIVIRTRSAQDFVGEMWPWSDDWWKPGEHRRNLVKACALGLAEIERLDRAASPHAKEGGEHA